ARKAGIKPGDAIVAIDGRPLRSAADLRNRIGLAPVGENVNLQVARGDSARDVQVRVGSAPNTASASGAPGSSGRTRPALAGATVRDIERGSPGHGKVEGVVVEDVGQGTPTGTQGLRPGEVKTGVNRKPVHNVSDFNETMAQTGQ